MASISKDMIFAYLSGLVAECGPSPSITDAASYSARANSLVKPGDVIYGLKASNWSDALDIYNRYLATGSASLNAPVAMTAQDGSASDFETVTKRKPRYTREDLLLLLEEMYEEFGGQFTVKQFKERAKIKPTPAFETIRRYFGPMRSWPAAIGKPIEQKTKEPKQAKQAQTRTPKADRPKSTPGGQKLEIRIWIPGSSEPIVMEFTIK